VLLKKHETKTESADCSLAFEDYTSRQSLRGAIYSLPVIISLMFFEEWPPSSQSFVLVSCLICSMLFRIGSLKILKPSKISALLFSTVFLSSACFWGLWIAHLSNFQTHDEWPYSLLVLAGVGVSAVVSLALHPRLLVSYLVLLISSFILPLALDHKFADLAPLCVALFVFVAFSYSQSAVLRNLLKSNRKSTLLMEQLIDAFPGYVTLIDAEKRYRFVGSSVAKLAAKSRSEIAGQPIGFAGMDEYFVEHLNNFLASDRQATQFEHLIDSRYHLVQFRRLSTQDVLAVSLDIHDVVVARQLHLEEQRVKQHGQQLQMLGQLAAGIAHEINNPLAIALGACESAQRQLSKPEPNFALVNTRLETIMVANERAAKIVRSMRLLARNPDLSDLSEQSLQQMNEDVLALCDTKLQTQGIDFRYEWQLDEADIKVIAHPIYFTQIVLNLIWNARDATLHEDSPQKKIRLIVHKLGTKLRLSVENTGPMIPAELHDKIMAPFFTTKSNGTGMGLSLSKSWADAMGAELSFESGPQKTQFHLDISIRE